MINFNQKLGIFIASYTCDTMHFGILFIDFFNHTRSFSLTNLVNLTLKF